MSHAFRKFKIALIAGLLMSLSLQAIAQVQPIWSYEDSVEVVVPLSSGSPAWPVSFADGRLMGLGKLGNVFYGTSIAALPDAHSPPIVGAFPNWGGNYGPQDIKTLASQADRALLALYDSSSSFSFSANRQELVFLKSNGQAVWSRPVAADSAKFLGNGDVIVQSGAQISRLASANGAPIWQQNLLELDPDSYSASVIAISEPGVIDSGSSFERFVVDVSFRASPRSSNINRNYSESIQFNAASGAIDWRVSSENSDLGYVGCETVIGGNTTVTLEFSRSKPGLAAVGRSSLTGEQRWRTEIPIPEDGRVLPCDVLPVEDGFLIAVVNETTATISKIAASGLVQWSQASPAVSDFQTPRLLANGDLGVLIANKTSAHIFQLNTGAPLRQIALTVNPHGTDTHIRLTHAELVEEYYGGQNAYALHRVRYALSTGLQIDDRAVALQTKSRQSGSIFLADIGPGTPIPFALRQGFGLLGRTVTLRRLDPITGVVAQTSAVELPVEAGQLDSAQILRADLTSAIVQTQSVQSTDRSRTITLARLENNASSPTWTQSFRALSAGALDKKVGSVVMSIATCPAPGECNTGNATRQIRAFDHVTGGLLYEIDKPHQSAITLGNFIVLTKSAPLNLEAINTAGNSLWNYPIAAAASPSQTSVNKLYSFNDDVMLELADIGGNLRQTRLFRISGLTGQPVWQRVFEGQVSTVSSKTNDGILFSANVRESFNATYTSGRFYYLVASSGVTRFEDNVGGQYFFSMRPIGDGKLGIAPVRKFRGFMYSPSLPSVIGTVSLLDYQTGVLGAEHVYRSDLGDALSSGASADIEPQFRASEVFARVNTPATDGISTPFFQRWPAISDANAGDLKIIAPDWFDETLRSLGPQATIDLVISNAAPSAVTATLGYLDDQTMSTAVIRACQASLGSICPPLGTGANVQAQLAPFGQLNLTVELTDPSFTQHRFSFGPPSAGGKFFALPDYAFGDRNMDNNFLFIRLNTKSFGNGFE